MSVIGGCPCKKWINGAPSWNAIFLKHDRQLLQPIILWNIITKTSISPDPSTFNHITSETDLALHELYVRRHFGSSHILRGNFVFHCRKHGCKRAKTQVGNAGTIAPKSPTCDAICSRRHHRRVETNWDSRALSPS